MTTDVQDRVEAERDAEAEQKHSKVLHVKVPCIATEHTLTRHRRPHISEELQVRRRDLPSNDISASTVTRECIKAE